MAEDNLFSRVKNAIRGQKSSFCSRSTKVTILGYDNMMEVPIIQYTNCDGVVSGTTYGDIISNGGYIPDCVQGGSPVTFVNNNVKSFKGISESNGPQPNLKLFVQYGTTDCNTPPPPPPGSNLIVIDCDKGDSFVVDPSGFTLTKDSVYYIVFDSLLRGGCFTIGNTTNQLAIDSIQSVSFPLPDCQTCLNPPA